METELRYVPVSLSTICDSYAKKYFREGLQMVRFWVDESKDAVIYELIENTAKEQS